MGDSEHTSQDAECTEGAARRAYSTARNRLSALQVTRLSEPGYHHDGGGLYLQVSSAERKSWVFRYRLAGRLRDMGLGPLVDVSLADARRQAADLRQKLREKIDPLDERAGRLAGLVAKRDADAAQREAEAARVTFQSCAETYHEREAPKWKNKKHRDQWINTLKTYVYPALATRHVETITKADLLRVLEPIWAVKPETASRVRQRIRAVLEWAAAKDHFPGYQDAMWAQIEKSLGQNQATAKREHHAACPYRELPSVLKALRSCASREIVKLAFEFTVLTAARSGETRGALWSEIDLEEAVWVIPASRMKAGKEHRVPLAPRCIEILKAAKLLTGKKKLVFCHPTTGKEYSDAVFTSVIHKQLNRDFTMHGFRSTFRDWGSERTNHARELLEVALAHLPGDSTEHSYWRADVLEKRRQLMIDWADYGSGTAAASLPDGKG